MHIFTYGTLMLPEVMVAVTRQRFEYALAELDGYARYCIEGAPYPGLVPETDAATDGVVYFDVDPATVARLDAFEGDAYRRVRVEVCTVEGARVAAEAYVLVPAHRHRIVRQTWSLEAFQTEHLNDFMLGYPGFGRI